MSQQKRQVVRRARFTPKAWNPSAATSRPPRRSQDDLVPGERTPVSHSSDDGSAGAAISFSRLARVDRPLKRSCLVAGSASYRPKGNELAASPTGSPIRSNPELFSTRRLTRQAVSSLATNVERRTAPCPGRILPSPRIVWLVPQQRFGSPLDATGTRDGVKELRSAFGPVRATDMGFVTSALYPDIQKAEHRSWDLIPNSQELTRISHVQAMAIFLIFTFLYTQQLLRNRRCASLMTPVPHPSKC